MSKFSHIEPMGAARASFAEGCASIHFREGVPSCLRVEDPRAAYDAAKASRDQAEAQMYTSTSWHTQVSLAFRIIYFDDFIHPYAESAGILADPIEDPIYA